jgi:protein-L-isoaspartate(D-aspartate) O-methyltransferase
VPIGNGQTISQPYIVAFMTEAAQIRPGAKVLEIGTGSGYQSAILALTGAEVYSIEIIPSLGERAKADLARLGLKVNIRVGDGFAGWPEQAPFDAVVVTAAPPRVPAPLFAQLKDGGRLVIPVGPEGNQVLEIHTKRGKDITVTQAFPVRFVPMTGEAERPPAPAKP